jgi:hypothetical protein
LNVALQDSLSAFRETLATSGENIELSNGNRTLATVGAVVDRGMSAAPLDRGEINFDERNVTRIEFLKCDISIAPVVGQTFKDCCDNYHRIRVVRKTELTYRCDCEEGPSL